MNDKVSVIVPVYNIEARYIEKCIGSILCQTYKNLEIFIIDDGSEGECGSICDKFAEKDDRIFVVHKENEGVSTCRNYGICHSSGEWLVFVDGDDWIERNYVEKLLNIAKKENADIAICDCIIEYEKKSIHNSFFADEYLDSDDIGKDRFILQFLCSRIYCDSLSATDSGAPWAKIYRREFIKKNNILYDDELRRMQDNVFNLYAYEYSRKIVYFGEGLYHYRKSSSSGFSKYNEDIEKTYICVFENISQYIFKFRKDERYLMAMDYKVIFSMYVILKTDLCHKDNKYTYFEKKKKLNKLLDNDYYVTALKRVDRSLLTKPELLMQVMMRLRCLWIMKVGLVCKNLLYKIIGKGS